MDSEFESAIAKEILENEIDDECEDDRTNVTNGKGVGEAADDSGPEIILEFDDEQEADTNPMSDAVQEAIETLADDECDDMEALENEEGDEMHDVNEEEEEEDEDEEEEEIMKSDDIQVQQVPKKRKDAALLTAIITDEIAEENSPNIIEKSEEDVPTSSIRARANKEKTVDEEQCRVCMSKEDLVSIFKILDNITIAEMLMTICPTVSIVPKDFMPQFICNNCIDSVTIAVQLKSQCETTERELRKKLPRSKNKVRRPTGYVVIDAPIESDPSDEDEASDDVEFKVSDEAITSPDDDSEDSDFSEKKRRVSRGGGPGKRGGRRKTAVTTPTLKNKKFKPTSVMKRSHPNDGDAIDDDSSEDEVMHNIKKRQQTSGNTMEFACNQCDQKFTRKLSLVLHKKVHASGRDPIRCAMCGKQFKMLSAYRTHMERHQDELSGHECVKCNKIFSIKAELRHHQDVAHKVRTVPLECKKCKQTFVTQVRFDRHKESDCPGYDVSQKKKNEYDNHPLGKDLFKSVAPLTTTYWSDSFSD